MNQSYVTVNADIDLSDVDLSDLFEAIEDDELEAEAKNRGLIKEEKTQPVINLEEIRTALCDKFGINHLSEWGVVIELLKQEVL